MASVYGKNIKISLFGESHGKAVGCVIDGLPPGFSPDISFIERRLRARQDGAVRIGAYAERAEERADEHAEERADAVRASLLDALDLSPVLTKRAEKTAYQVLSGLSKEGYCLGSPLCVFFENLDVRREDYERQREVYRPGHADYVSAVRSGGFADLSGGGHFSGRVTAPLVFAGALCEQILAGKGISLSAEMASIGGIELPKGSDSDGARGGDDSALRERLDQRLDQRLERRLERLFTELKEAQDSVGCKIRVRIDGLPLGVGSPFFDTLEGEIAKAVFAVPAVKGIEFGTGFAFAAKRGSEVVDAFVLSKESGRPDIVTDHNHNGGINGGISNGMPVVFNVAVKPASSIGVPVRTLHFGTMEEETLVTGGRHDRCIGFRAMAGIVAATSIALLDQVFGVE